MLSLPRRLSHCILDGEVFKPGSEYISFLDFKGARKDFCCTCWSKMVKPEGGHCWRGTIPPKKVKMIPPDRKALEVFRTTDNSKLKFILTLYLLRKKQLVRLTQTLYEIPETGEIFDIAFVPISHEEEGELIQQVHQLTEPSVPSER